jgi:ABC-type dipeptide/oligopeptide/nickel transport system permease subunit
VRPGRLLELRVRRSTAIAAVLFASIIAYCVLFPLVSPYEANGVDFTQSRQTPSLHHPLGTDTYGRDLLTRLAVGGRTTLLIASIALSAILAAGVIWGTTAAMAGGLVDSVMMRLVDGLLAIPRLPVAIVILVALRLNAQNVLTIALALAVVGWMQTARLVRGQVLSLTRRDYVRAARALGASRFEIARRHVIPNSTGIILVAILLELPTVVLGEAFIAVLGLGPDPPTATWGNIAQDGLYFARLWEPFLASTAIALFAISANVLIDSVDEMLDPRRRVAMRRERRVSSAAV